MNESKLLCKTVLKEHKKIKSAVRIYGISRSDSGVSYSMTIEKIKNNELENDNPKSRITLDDEEIKELILFLFNDFNNSLPKINLDFSKNKITNFKGWKVLYNDPSFKKILDNKEYYKNIDLHLTMFERINFLREFKDNLDLDLKESHWQNSFNKNKWIFGNEYIGIVNERRIDKNNISDYLMKSFDGFLDIIEIKKPSLNFWNNKLDHNNLIPSKDLINAITQCNNYLYELERESGNFKSWTDYGVKIIRPRCLLVFGRSNDWEEKHYEAFRILNSSLNKIQIITYDQLLQKASYLLNLDNKEQ